MTAVEPLNCGATKLVSPQPLWNVRWRTPGHRAGAHGDARSTRRRASSRARATSAWSSTTAGGQPAFPRDLLLGTLTLYWVTGTISSSLLPYWAYAHDPAAAIPAGEPPDVPTAISIFGGERVPLPKP